MFSKSSWCLLFLGSRCTFIPFSKLFFTYILWFCMMLRDEAGLEISCEKVFLKFSQKWGMRPTTLYKKETVAQVFSCKFCEIFTSTYFYRIPSMATSERDQPYYDVLDFTCFWSMFFVDSRVSIFQFILEFVP